MAKKVYIYSIYKIMLLLLLWEVIFWTIAILLLSSYGYFEVGIGRPTIGFNHPDLLHLLWIILPLIMVYCSFMFWKNMKLKRIGNRFIQSRVLRPVSVWNTFLKFFLFRNFIVFLIIAMAQPVYGTKKINSYGNNLEVVVALDISSSMNVKDIDKETSRLEVAKRAIVQMINILKGEKLGIVIFASSAYVQLPLTNDYGAAKMYVAEIQTNMVSRQGTNIAEALAMSKKMFVNPKASKAVILITDAEDHEGGLKHELEEYKTAGIHLSTLVVGTKAGGLIPNRIDKPEFGYKVDKSGTPIISRYNEQFIQNIHVQSEGLLVVGDSPYPDLASLLGRIKKIRRTRGDALVMDIRANYYQIPLCLSLANWLFFLGLPFYFSVLKRCQINRF